MLDVLAKKMVSELSEYMNKTNNNIKIGCDILEVDRIKKILDMDDYVNDPYIIRSFTSDEIALCENRPVPLYAYATRFAGKEAIFKALNITGEDVKLIDIEILENANGSSKVNLKNTALNALNTQGLKSVELSLSYENQYALAFAIAT